MKLNPRAVGFTAYVMTCLILTHLPPPAIPRTPIPGVDKVVHLLIYLGMGFFCAKSWSFPRPQLIRVFLGLLLFAAIDEITQPPFGRTADAFDWAFDAAGARLGLFLATRW